MMGLPLSLHDWFVEMNVVKYVEAQLTIPTVGDRCALESFGRVNVGVFWCSDQEISYGMVPSVPALPLTPHSLSQRYHGDNRPPSYFSRLPFHPVPTQPYLAVFDMNCSYTLAITVEHLVSGGYVMPRPSRSIALRAAEVVWVVDVVLGSGSRGYPLFWLGNGFSEPASALL
jgi:hypothetical protein